MTTETRPIDTVDFTKAVTQIQPSRFLRGIRCLSDTPLEARAKVLLRADFNVPVNDAGAIADDQRIRAVLPTIMRIVASGGSVRLASHFGRPKVGSRDPKNSLHAVAEALTRMLGKTVRLDTEWPHRVSSLAEGEVALMENVRLLDGETGNDAHLGELMAQDSTHYVLDAFASAHRAHASTHAVARCFPKRYAGLLLEAELRALAPLVSDPVPPVVAIVGGSKISTKYGMLKVLMERVDHLILGGGILNVFLLAAGHEIGKSLVERDRVNDARALLDAGKIRLPDRVIVAPAIDAGDRAREVDVAAIQPDDMVLDVAPSAVSAWTPILQSASTVLWNGPMGVFERAAFHGGTRALMNALSVCSGYRVGGGGDTLAAVAAFPDQAGCLDYLSTGGGALLELIEKSTLPAIETLRTTQTTSQK